MNKINKQMSLIKPSLYRWFRRLTNRSVGLVVIIPIPGRDLSFNLFWKTNYKKWLH